MSTEKPPFADFVACIHKRLEGRAYDFVEAQLGGRQRPWVICLELDDEEIGRGEHPSKYDAMQLAARAGLQTLERQDQKETGGVFQLSAKDRFQIILMARQDVLLSLIAHMKPGTGDEQARGICFVFTTRRGVAIYVRTKEDVVRGNMGFFLSSPTHTNLITAVICRKMSNMDSADVFSRFLAALKRHSEHLLTMSHLALV